MFFKVGSVIYTNIDIYFPDSLYCTETKFLLDSNTVKIKKEIRYHPFDRVKFDISKEKVKIKTTKDVWFSSSKVDEYFSFSIFDEYNVVDIIAYCPLEEYREKLLSHFNI
jgi:hypothetical protein